MSRFLARNKDGTYTETIESMEECKWRINDMCCNDSSDYLGDEYCWSESGKKRSCFEKEDGIIENGGEPFSLETYYDK